MINQYPLWKYLLIVVVILTGVLYALPNLYGEVPVIQIAPVRSAPIDDATQQRVIEQIKSADISYQSIERTERGIMVRFSDTEDQLKARDAVSAALGTNYVVALNLVSATPDWLTNINALPMYLGLDLRGGVHFLMSVDMDTAVRQAEERYVSDIRAALRGEKIRYLAIGRGDNGGLEIKFRDSNERQQGHEFLSKEYPQLKLQDIDQGNDYYIQASIGEQEISAIKKLALETNIKTLRNRVNELGVAEPVIQQQGQNRIVVQLPGVQDPARAKEILGATATLEFHLQDETHDPGQVAAGQVPFGSNLYRDRSGKPVLLQKEVIVTGDQIINAASGIDQQTGTPNVSITLDGKGARRMGETTSENVGKNMAVVFIENKPQTRMVDGKQVKTTRKVEEVINIATIRDQFSKHFQITGLDSTEEARDLALLLRAGALAAPIEIVEERTVGPSLGQDNIDQGFMSVVIGFVLVLVFMAVWYRAFGLVANLALALNLVLIVAVLSMLQATLTLPGIAGIVLTIGMAVDANVLIFERIREEVRNGNSPQASINAGYEKALSTIADANITTLIAAVVLYGFGTGPIKGFAVTLSIGILTSMFTAIMGSRAVINLVYGGRKVKKLAI